MLGDVSDKFDRRSRLRLFPDPPSARESASRSAGEGAKGLKESEEKNDPMPVNALVPSALVEGR